MFLFLVSYQGLWVLLVSQVVSHKLLYSTLLVKRLITHRERHKHNVTPLHVSSNLVGSTIQITRIALPLVKYGKTQMANVPPSTLAQWEQTISGRTSDSQSTRGTILTCRWFHTCFFILHHQWACLVITNRANCKWHNNPEQKTCCHRLLYKPELTILSVYISDHD